MADFIPKFTTSLSETEAKMLNPLVLAFVGDAVQTLYVRTKVACSTDCKTNALHRMVSDEINATRQSEMAQKLMDEFYEDEMAVFKRARNSKVHTSAKNASIGDYKTASGFEAVLGYLYLTDKHDRITYLIQKGGEV